jgi:hypothetical protein
MFYTPTSKAKIHLLQNDNVCIVYKTGLYNENEQTTNQMPEVIIRLLVFFVHPQGLLVDRQAAFYDKEKAYPTTFFSTMYDLNSVGNFLSDSSPNV